MGQAAAPDALGLVGALPSSCLDHGNQQQADEYEAKYCVGLQEELIQQVLTEPIVRQSEAFSAPRASQLHGIEATGLHLNVIALLAAIRRAALAHLRLWIREGQVRSISPAFLRWHAGGATRNPIPEPIPTRVGAQLSELRDLACGGTVRENHSPAKHLRCLEHIRVVAHHEDRAILLKKATVGPSARLLLPYMAHSDSGLLPQRNFSTFRHISGSSLAEQAQRRQEAQKALRSPPGAGGEPTL
eukprot:CAMPEP_0181464956 /NCGR_PEP_ID=MMETSP1110-20121109/35702_1 /TAXON_ID=174948 /ORGANISM="Symbiodinium sp., Strain CCMP421" /LENGTH=243 /DNA_ID=CAMNT_0023589711 /DNA_START=2319 /DNA_END=3049 /DNA_ORIENTATION=+